jgi:branched-chain amino acid aminotransferase
MIIGLSDFSIRSLRRDMSERLVWMNGQLVPETEARISIYDSALMFGDTVFEMTRSFGKKQFRLREHLERLYSGLKILRIPLTISIDEMTSAVDATVQANDHLFAADDEHRIMIDVSRGLLGIYQGHVAIPKGPNVLIADFPLRWTVAGMGKLFDHGINAVVPSQRAIPASLLDPKVKNRSRVHYLMANIEVSQVEGDDNWALLMDPNGFVAEGTGANFFIVRDRTIISPEGRNILRGISRDYVMKELAPELDIPVVEKNIETYDIHTADEAFMTGTPFCMLPVTRLDGVPISDGKVGPVFKQVLNAWSNSVQVDIPEQIKAWDASRDSIVDGDLPTPYRFKTKSSVQ